MRVILFTGKGGVGKTSLAAATAVKSAATGKRTMVLSTDIAHSLADSLDVELGNEPREIVPNLWGQETDIYVLLKQGAYVYAANSNKLDLAVAEDLRAVTGAQSFFKDAPVALVFVADLSKMGNGSNEGKKNTANIDVGYISQNVYLFCASEGLATGVRAWIDKDVLAKAMKLTPNQHIILAQSVGFPVEK